MPLKYDDKDSLVYSYSIYTLDQTKPLYLIAIAGAISAPIKGYFTMQRNANMQKKQKKVRFCRLYWFLCKNTVSYLSPELTFVLQENFITH